MGREIFDLKKGISLSEEFNRYLANIHAWRRVALHNVLELLPEVVNRGRLPGMEPEVAVKVYADWEDAKVPETQVTTIAIDPQSNDEALLREMRDKLATKINNTGLYEVYSEQQDAYYRGTCDLFVPQFSFRLRPSEGAQEQGMVAVAIVGDVRGSRIRNRQDRIALS